MNAAALIIAMLAAPETTLWDAPPALSMSMVGLPRLVVNAELDEWVRDRLEAYRLYPAQAQAQLDGLRLAWDKLVAVEVAAARIAYVSETAELRAEVGTRWPTWVLAGGIVIGVAFGIGLAWLGAQFAPVAR